MLNCFVRIHIKTSQFTDGWSDMHLMIIAIYMHCTIASTQLTSTMTTLYISVVRFLYCIQLWHPHLMKNILIIEQIQHNYYWIATSAATKPT